MLLGGCLTNWDHMIEVQAVQQAGPGGPAKRQQPGKRQLWSQT